MAGFGRHVDRLLGDTRSSPAPDPGSFRTTTGSGSAAPVTPLLARVGVRAGGARSNAMVPSTAPPSFGDFGAGMPAPPARSVGVGQTAPAFWMGGSGTAEDAGGRSTWSTEVPDAESDWGGAWNSNEMPTFTPTDEAAWDFSASSGQLPNSDAGVAQDGGWSSLATSSSAWATTDAFSFLHWQ